MSYGAPTCLACHSYQALFSIAIVCDCEAGHLLHESQLCFHILCHTTRRSDKARAESRHHQHFPSTSCYDRAKALVSSLKV